MTGLLAIAISAAAGPVTRVDDRSTGSARADYSFVTGKLAVDIFPAAYQLCMECVSELYLRQLPDLKIADALPRFVDSPADSSVAVFRKAVRRLPGESDPPVDNPWTQLEGICGIVMLTAPLVLRAVIGLPFRPRRN